VALSLNNLAWLYYTQGQYEKAEPLYGRALAIWEKALQEDLNVATCLENYAILQRKMDRLEEAEPLEARVRAIRAKERLIRNPGGEAGRTGRNGVVKTAKAPISA
jgi:tetratricopeptide (TPR) repeat protein